MKDFGLSRNVPMVPAKVALILIYVQKYIMENGGEKKGILAAETEAKYGFFFAEIRQRAIPNMKKLLAAQRETGIEVVYMVMAASRDDEIVLPKGSSLVLISTNINYLARNMGKTQSIVMGALTGQCVDSAVRDVCDLGYLVTLPVDVCATQSRARHDSAPLNNKGYCRQVTTGALPTEISVVV